MKLRSIEMTMIMFLVTAAVLGLGYYFFIMPNNKTISELDTKITETKNLIQEAEVAIQEQAAVEKRYEEAKPLPVEAQKVFYPEMDITEAEKTIAKILKDKGYQSVSGITISKMQPISLTVPIIQDDADINYDIRQYTFLQSLGDAGAVETQTDTSGDVTVTLKEAMKYLKEEKNRDNRIEMANVVRNMLNGASAEIAVIKGTFSLSLTNAQYRQFLDYVESLPQETSVSVAEFKNANSDSGTAEIYGFEMNLYVVREMDLIE